MKWLHQIRSHGIGNFVMITPALQLVSEQIGRPVPVYFDTPEIYDLYNAARFISKLKNKPGGKPTWTNRRPTRIGETESDIQAYCRVMAGVMDNDFSDIPWPYIDPVKTRKLNRVSGRKYVAVFHGCLGKGFMKHKDLGDGIRRFIINSLLKRSITPVLLGNRKDIQKFWSRVERRGCIDFIGKLKLRDSVSILGQCDKFISNDTGLYHVAGALRIPGLVLWKTTDWKKNTSPFRSIVHAINREGNPKMFRRSINQYLGPV